MSNDGSISLPYNARILIVKLHAGIGDALLIMPSIRAIRESYPGARVDLLTVQALEPLAKKFNLLDTIICQPATMTFDELLNNLHSVQYDAVLFFQRLVQPTRLKLLQHMTAAIGAKWNVGLENGQGTFLNVKVHDSGYGIKHQAEYMMDIARAVGAVVRDKSLFFPLTEEDRHQAHSILWDTKGSSPSEPLIAMHPGCGSYQQSRRWIPERFAQLADELYANFGGQLLLLGGPEELALREHVVRSMRSAMPAQSLSGQEDISVVAAIIKQCDLFIGNDSGLMHVSAAVGTRTVGIFGLTNHKAWGPYTPVNAKQSIVARLNLPCMPCNFVGYENGNHEGCATRDCLNNLSVDVVFDAAHHLLSELYEKQN